MKWIPNFTHAPGPVEVQKFHMLVLLTVAILYNDVWASNVTMNELLLMKELDSLVHRLEHRLRDPARPILFVNRLPTDIFHHYHLAKTAPTPLGGARPNISAVQQ